MKPHRQSVIIPPDLRAERDNLAERYGPRRPFCPRCGAWYQHWVTKPYEHDDKMLEMVFISSCYCYQQQSKPLDELGGRLP